MPSIAGCAAVGLRLPAGLRSRGGESAKNNLPFVPPIISEFHNYFLFEILLGYLLFLH